MRYLEKKDKQTARLYPFLAIFARGDFLQGRLVNHIKAMANESDINWGNHYTLLALGNGFDIDLGLPTSYLDFFKSDYFPFVRGGQDFHRLGEYIFDRGVVKKWYDLENILAEFGETNKYLRQEEIEENRSDYERLSTSLTYYLKSIDFSRIRKDSSAAKILTSAAKSLIPPTIYTFNYTDLADIREMLGLSNIQPFYVHGSLARGNIILGVGDYARLDYSSDFMYKTNNRNYNPGDFFKELDLCDEVIIFGLSMSRVDYPYFEDFFSNVASGQYSGEHKKSIRIFTYDEDSRIEILRNLRTMNKGMIRLFNNSDFDIIRTKDDIDSEKVQGVCNLLDGWRLDTDIKWAQ